MFVVGLFFVVLFCSFFDWWFSFVCAFGFFFGWGEFVYLLRVLVWKLNSDSINYDPTLSNSTEIHFFVYNP